jgi:hypothetical protein
MPSTTRVFVPPGAVITRSYKYLPGVKLPVLAAVMAKVISPFAIPVTVVVKLLAVDE